MRIAFTSRRPFHDGPLEQPLPENDQVNMAYMIGANYFSFLTLKKLSDSQLVEKLRPYDIIFIPLDVRDLEGVKQIVAASNGRYAIYSEGGIADYQMLSPIDQLNYLQIIRQARAVFLYWEIYVPFFKKITTKPVFYLPYPFFLEMAEPFRVPFEERANRLSLPSGLVGGTRNGLSTLLAARQLLEENLYDQVDCWLSSANFRQDAEVVYQILTGTPLQTDWPKERANLRQWLLQRQIDYRPLLKLRNKLKTSMIPDTFSLSKTPTIDQENITLLRRHNWLAYLKRLGKNLLVVDLNNRPTVGRNALDCAALMIPCLSTNYSDIQSKLFPQTTVADSWQIDEVVEIGRRLKDQGFYREVTQEATLRLQEFLPDSFRKRFDKIVSDHPEIWIPTG